MLENKERPGQGGQKGGLDEALLFFMSVHCGFRMYNLRGYLLSFSLQSKICVIYF